MMSNLTNKDAQMLHSFPTRRSSDLRACREAGRSSCCGRPRARHGVPPHRAEPQDRKSTRLNSSHDQISYAVFCLKKKKSISKKSPAIPGVVEMVIRLLF